MEFSLSESSELSLSPLTLFSLSSWMGGTDLVGGLEFDLSVLLVVCPPLLVWGAWVLSALLSMRTRCLTCLALTEFGVALEFGVTTGAFVLRGILNCFQRLKGTW